MACVTLRVNSLPSEGEFRIQQINNTYLFLMFSQKTGMTLHVILDDSHELSGPVSGKKIRKNIL